MAVYGRTNSYPTRSHYLVKFSDETFQIDWKVKNLCAFLRGIFNTNRSLRNAWEGVFETDTRFASVMAGKAAGQMFAARARNGETTANFYLFPKDHADYKKFYATITRFYPTKDYMDNTLTTKKFKR